MRTLINRTLFAVSIAACTLFSPLAIAAVTTFVNNAAGFSAAASVAGHVSIGVEDFESSTVAPATLPLPFGPTITPGVATTYFPTGTSTVRGITVQSNTLGNSPATLSPGNIYSLATASAGYVGTPDDQVSSNLPGESFDMIFNPPSGAARAVTLTPLFFDVVSGVNFTDTMTIRVYNTVGTLIATQSFVGGHYQTEASRFAVVTTGTDNIGRINIYGAAGVTAAYGADDIEVFIDRKSTRLNSSHSTLSRMPSSA